MSMRRLWCVLVSSIAVWQNTPAGAEIVVVGPEQRTAIGVTLYSQENLALVREVRHATLPAGDSELRFTAVPEQLDPRTLSLAATDKGAALVVHEQTFRYDLAGGDRLLSRWLGKPIELVETDEQLTSKVTSAELVALGPPAWDPAFAPDGTTSGTAYDFRYQPATPDADGRVRGFRIITKKRVPRRAFTESFSMDQDGVLRRSSLDWASDADRIEYETSLAFATFVGMCDAFHELHGCYPPRLIKLREPGAGPGAMMLPSNTYIAPVRLDVRPDGSTIIREGGDIETITYLPDESPHARPARYRAWYRARRRSVGDVRSYVIDQRGVVHVTAEDRAATADDPVVISTEFDRRRADGRKWALEFLQMKLT
jgi:hypothetical protein